MSSITPKTKAAALARVRALIAGTQQHFPNGSFTLGNTAYTSASLISELQILETALLKVDAAQASATEAVQGLRDTTAKVDSLLRDYRRFLLTTFGAAAQTLADFGLQPSKAHKPISTEKRAAATAKLRATRQARGTTSKKQKLAIKGDVTGVTVTPVHLPGNASPTQPAPAASSTPPAQGSAAAK